jgi:hypothetical protein
MPVSPSNKEGQGSQCPPLSPIWGTVASPTPKKYERSHWASHPKYERSHGSRTATADFAAQPLHNPAISLVAN